MTNIRIITKEGKEITLAEWQKQYGLPVGSDKIGMYFSYKTDPKLAQDLKDYSELVVNEILITFLDQLRIVAGSLTINSFNRNEAKQQSLREQGFRAAYTSPHVAKMAADVDTVSPEQTRKLAKIARDLANKLGLKIRLGFEEYLQKGQTFLHIDVCPEFFAKGKPFHAQPHPSVWELSINW